MATKAEINQYLKENNVTEEQLDAFWEENFKINHKVRAIAKAGRSWRDLSIIEVAKLPTLKEDTLKAREQKQLEEQAEMAERAKVIDEIEYRRKHFEDIMIEKIDNAEDLTEDELAELVSDYEIDIIEGENLPWQQCCTTIIQLKDRTFSIDWQRALTESQTHDYMEQPVEVKKVEYEKTITVSKWVCLDKPTG